MSLATAKEELKLQYCVGACRKIPPCSLENGGAETVLKEHMTADALVVIWQTHRIVWGRWQGGTLTLAPHEETTPEYWQEIRAFNATEELRLRRDGDLFSGRYRKDEQDGSKEGPTAYIDSFSRFWGKKEGDAENAYVTLIDHQRKLRLTIPVDDEGARWYGLETRNYVGSDEKTGLSGYIDYRFLGIFGAEEGQ